MTFRILGLPEADFQDLFALADDELAARGAVRQIVKDRAPCRVSLTDAGPGDEVFLVNYEHHAVASPYRMRFAVYVREGERRFDEIDVVPAQLRSRMLALRAFDGRAMMVGYELVDGRSVEEAIHRRFADSDAAYIHAHFAAPGCYACRIERA